MRVGDNPEKAQNRLETNSYHRIVIPVYIPNLSDNYFKDALKIFELCFQSLYNTIHSKTRITLVNNGCCEEVSKYLLELYESYELVDQLLNSKINLGKVNALYSAIKSNLEPLITISDADVMFLPHWQECVENIHSEFPEAGMVSPVPTSIGYKGEFLYTTISYALTRGQLKFSRVIHPEGLEKFEQSIGRKMYNRAHKKKYLTISKNNVNAVLGCGHFAATYKAEVFEHAPSEICQLKIVGNSEKNYLDRPNDIGGFLRLATDGNYAYHLGNVYETWMGKQMDEIKNTKNQNITLDSLPNSKPLKKFHYIIGKICHYILFKKLKSVYFRLKGMKYEY
ncbi:MAG: glycosyltransferase family A protein [Jejuia sp.]